MAVISPVGDVKEIGKCILTQCIQPPVKRHINYWWCFDDNINDLRDGDRDLARKIHDLKQKIEEARLRTQVLRPGVEEWLNHASEKLAEARRKILQYENIPKAWNITSRYSMGKTAKKTAEEMAKLIEDGYFETIADDALPPAMRFTCQTWTMGFESRKDIEKGIIDYLKNGNVSMIWICGMGGVGKTIMAKRIGEAVNKEGFHEVVMVTVGKQNEMRQIQEDIAFSLKLKFEESESRMPARADKLRTRLMDAKKKLIIFDDVWETLKFEDLGIPCKSNSERCKVLLTSRFTDTCKGIKNKKVFELKILEKEEAWILFKKRAGDCVEDSDLYRVARDVAAKCKGLPIALVTVATALHDEKDIYKWKYSLSELDNPMDFTDFPELLEHVYKPLKLSYDYLDNNVAKNLFLLCCLFPEDYDIPIEQLTFYSMGLRLFDGNSSIEDARNRTHTLVGKLKSRFLLIDSEKELHVNMHDAVREVAIYIGSKEMNGFLKILNKTSIERSSDGKCNWMSVDISNERMEIPMASSSPNLQLLMLLNSSSKKISNISFQGMENLKVFSFPSTWVGSLPSSLRLLQKLQTLCLFECEVENISIIGELKSLEIFQCNGCKKIMQLPEEIGRLNCLRLLELNGCSNLVSIPFGILSSLVKLEELKMLGSFNGWEAEENGSKEMRNASLTELESLPNLTCLMIEVSDSNLAAQPISLSPKLVKHRIHIGLKDDWNEGKDHENVMKLNLPKDIGAVGNWIQMLVSKSECLYLKEDGSGNFNLAETGNLRNLEFGECSRMKSLVKTKDCKSGIVFPFLESLNLLLLENSEETCDGTIILNQNVSLCNLKCIYITNCSNLRYLFTLSMARRCLFQLEILDIRSCDAMEQVFRNEIRDDYTDGCIEFPKLKKLTLNNLPNLTAFYEGVETIQFPQLTKMVIANLPKLNNVLSSQFRNTPSR